MSPPRAPVAVRYLPTATNTRPRSNGSNGGRSGAAADDDGDDDGAALDDAFESSLGTLLLDADALDLGAKSFDRRASLDAAPADVVPSSSPARPTLPLVDPSSSSSSSSLTSSSSSSTTTTTTTSSSSGKTRPPVCRFFLIGDCRIRNCAFLHTRDVACKFWSRTGHCARGDDCMYKHDALSPTAAGSPSSPSVLSTAAAADLAGSPSVASIWHTGANGVASSPASASTAATMLLLAPAAAAAASSSAAPAAPLEQFPHAKGSWSLATKLRLKELQEQFSHVPAAVVENMFVEAGCRNDVAAARLMAAAPPPAAPAAPAAPASGAAVSDELRELRREQAAAERALKEMQTQSVPWVATGEALDAEYKSKREAAIAAAVQRNRMFEMATQAYRRGDKKAARDLSAQGRRLQAEMEELHAQAASDIFRARNSEHGRSDLLDLHGLHPDEAVELVKKHVQKIRREAKNRKERMFTVVTGTGHHAWNTQTRSKLRDAVVEALDRLGCLHRDTSTDQRGGMLSVIVPNANAPPANTKKR